MTLYENRAEEIMHIAYSKWLENGSPFPLDVFLAKEINLAGLLKEIEELKLKLRRNQIKLNDLKDSIAGLLA